MQICRFASALGLLAVLACAGAQKSAVRSDFAERPWFEATSSHFVVTTDLPADRAIEATAELERYWQALASAYGVIAPGRRLPTSRMRVIHLAKCSDFYRVVWSKTIGGFVMITLDFTRERVVVTCDNQRFRGEVLVHEVAHNFNNHFFHGGPRWLNEGLAGFFQSLEFADNAILVGAPPGSDEATFSFSRGRPTVAALRADDVPVKGRRLHRAAWRLVHMLINGSQRYSTRFLKLLAGLSAGQSDEQAWNQAFGDVPAGELEKAYKAYGRDRRLGVRSLEWQPIESQQPIAVQPLSFTAAATVWLELVVHKADSEEAPEYALGEAIKQIESIEAARPEWPGGLFWRAIITATFEKAAALGNSEALLREYVAKNRDDSRAWLGIVNHRMAALISDPGNVDPPLEGLEGMTSDVTELIRVARRPEELQTIARFYGFIGEPETGYSFVRRAISASPSCGRCYETLALLAHQLGKSDEAEAAARIAIGVRPTEDGEPPRFVVQIANGTR